MTASNPFADESRAAAERRERSEGELANPYAAPPGGPEYQAEAGPGVGIWRLHEQVVIHQALDFPERCIYTNEPGTERRTLKLSYYEWFGLSHCSIKFGYSLSEAGAQKRAKELWGPLKTLGCGWLLCILGILFGGDGGWWMSPLQGFFWLAGLAGSVLTLIGFGWIGSRWRIMKLDHHEGPYFVLRGAGPAFLQSLPRWPGLR